MFATGDWLDETLKLVLITLIISVPLALWKLIDVIIWICNNISIGLK